MVKYLVESVNVNPFKVDIYNKTAKDLAIKFGRKSIKDLIEHAENQYQNKHGEVNKSSTTLSEPVKEEEHDSRSSSPLSVIFP